MQGQSPPTGDLTSAREEPDGSWFFGRPVYRRFIAVPKFTGSTYGPQTGKKVATIDGLGDLVDIKGSYNTSSGNLHCAIFANQAGSNSWHSGFYADSAGNLYWYGNATATPDTINGPFELVVYYTRGL